MTQKDKDLLLKDLSARLPYGVIVRHSDCIIDDNYNETGEFHYTKGYLYDVCRMDDMTTTIIESEGEREGYEHICFLERTIPYLRPMSSMTDTELVEFLEIRGMNINSEELKTFRSGKTAIVSLLPSYSRHIDWLLEHHFDYRGLIEKGLAIEVTENNNPYK